MEYEQHGALHAGRPIRHANQPVAIGSDASSRARRDGRRSHRPHHLSDRRVDAGRALLVERRSIRHPDETVEIPRADPDAPPIRRVRRAWRTYLRHWGTSSRRRQGKPHRHRGIVRAVERHVAPRTVAADTDQRRGRGNDRRCDLPRRGCRQRRYSDDPVIRVRADSRQREHQDYIRSGALIPSIESPFFNTTCAARASTRRAFMISAGSLSTCAL